MNDKKPPRRAPSRRDAMETRRKLLTEAGKAFAKHGFAGANLRDICKVAGVNLGAVNYYFGSKKELYREALIKPHLELMMEEPPPRLTETTTPEAALKSWIIFFMDTVLVRRRQHPYLSRLMIHEIANPSFALDELIQVVFKQIRRELVIIISALKARDHEDRQVGELANMIILLCAQQEMGRGVFERLGYPPPATRDKVSALAEKIYRFALAGIRAWE